MLDSNKMSDDIFDEQMLADKLSKLNSSQQSIEFLSGWCIKHRKKARQIVESWDKQFKSAQRAQRVSFLYLSNDILQNSRRKGSEFVNEFWKVLPAALKNVYGTGDENGKKAASRLVDIWEERKVFGSRGQNLKNEMLGKNPSPAPAVASNGKNSNPIKIVKRDAHSLRIKLAAGALPEKIITSFQSVHDQNVDEEVAFNKFKTAILRAGEIERNVESVSTQGNLQGSHLIEDVQEQESVLQQCINQLESAEAARDALVSHLKDALRDQEPVLERIRTQLQVARGQLDQVVNLREKLTSPPVIIHNQQLETSRAGEANLSLPQPTNLPPAESATSRTTEDENMKAAAAAVAAKLAASTSSAQMLTSVLSSLVAEEAASRGGSSKSAGLSSGLSMFPPEKRPKLEKPMSASDVNNSEAGNSSYFSSLQKQPMGNVPVSLSMQSMSQAGHMQAQFPSPAPPPPPGPPSNSPKNQFVQPASLMPYGYSPTSLPPPPPMPSHVAMGLARTAPPQMPPSSQTQSQQQNNNGGYYRPPGIGFYGQSHQPTPPPVPRQ